MVPGDEDEMVVPGGRPTEYVGPLETGVYDARATAVGAEGGLSVTREEGRRERRYIPQARTAREIKLTVFIFIFILIIVIS